MFCWHKWSKWEERKATYVRISTFEGVEVSRTDPYVKHLQKRVCEKCGRIQEEVVRN